MKAKSNSRFLLLPILLLVVFFTFMITSCGEKEVEKYTVTVIDAQGGVIYADKTEVNKGESVTITVEAFPLYELTSLKVNTEEVVPTNNVYVVTNVESDILISATFTKQSFLVSFNAGDGAAWVGEAPQPITVSVGEKYGALPNSNVAIKYDHMFVGWYTESGELVTADTLVENDEPHTLYAHWTKAITTRTASSSVALTGDDNTLSYTTKSASFATIDGVSVAQGSVSSTLVYDKSEPTRTGLIFKGSFENNITNLEDSTVEHGDWATGAGAQYYMFYIEMQSGTLLLYKTTGAPGHYIEITTLQNAGEAYRNKFNSGATEFELKATYCLNENGGLIIKLYIDNELQLWFEDATPLQGDSVGFCSTKANTEFKNFKYDNTVTKEMGSPIVSTNIAFTVSKGANDEYNTYKAWANSRSTAYLNEVFLDRSIGASGKVSANISPNATKTAIVLFASTSDVAAPATGVNGIHFMIEPTANVYKMYIVCVRNQNWVISELGANAVDLELPVATTYGVEIEYNVQANKDIEFTYTITVGENTYVRTASWPTSWDIDEFWSRNNFNNGVAIWQEAGGNAVVFGDVDYEGSKGIYALNATPSKSINASGSLSVDVTLNGGELGIAIFGEITPTTVYGFKGVLCYVSKDGTITIGFAKEHEYEAVVDSTTKADTSKVINIVYEYSIATNGVCTYKATASQNGIVVAVVECNGTATGDYWNQDNMGDSVLVYYQPLVVGNPLVENFVYTQN